ncbi:MAG: hypothetical protein IAF38_11605 [Bacteroidia bacterium]|nr:hypothetical protein [Bacteroidia bacterium]
MKKIILLLVFFSSLMGKIIAQEKVNISIKANFDTCSVKKYKKEKPEKRSGFDQLTLKIPYGDFLISNLKDAEDLKGGIIEKVELVYTQYPRENDFSELNQKRMAMLYFAAPNAFSSYMTKWKLVAQTGCHSESEASGYFHGFVITYRKAPSMESAMEEGEYIKRLADGREVIRDSTVIKILNRSLNWKNMVVVGDFTGSMSPYIGQLLCWYSLKLKVEKEKDKVKNFVFFNDGDMKPDAEKRTGATGGIYDCAATNYDTVINCAVKTIKAGYGGDAPENNVEALLFAQKKYTDAKEFILVADNWANMRDYELISSVKKPVHVILCGVTTEPNLQYIELAYKTKGSIHTMEEDLNDLFKKGEGQTFDLMGNRYRVYNGKIIRVGPIPVKS